ncbi:unnamed protein product, partial [Oppiella nova]
MAQNPSYLWGQYINSSSPHSQSLSYQTAENMAKFTVVIIVYLQFMGTMPILVVAEPELIKDITTKDFHKFSDRHDFLTGDPMNDSPTFSSGKMRSMHTIIIDCVKRLETIMAEKTADGLSELEVKRLMGNLTMDVIASCAFGTKIDTYNEQKRSEFVVNAEKVIRPNWRVFIFFMLMKTFPKILEWTQFKSTNVVVDRFFRSAIHSMVSSRKSQPNRHNDYLQLMINAFNKKFDNSEEKDIVGENERIYGQRDESEDFLLNKQKIELTEDDILANSVLFFVAGFETTASLLSFLTYSLALNEDCQQKLFDEITDFGG